jgi:hypothetical protein
VRIRFLAAHLVFFWHKADVTTVLIHVSAFGGEADIDWRGSDVRL